MAGDWLKIEAVTPDKPEVFEIATQCKVTPDDAFGKLFRVWRWFDQQTENGNARNVTWAYLDHVAGVTGFAKAMHSVGWLSGGEDCKSGVTLPNFDRHNGKTAKSRALTAKRVATHKKRTANDEVTPIALPREEKRRSKTPKPLETDLAFENFWRFYPKRVAKPDALRAWRKVPEAEHPAVMRALDAAKRSEQWLRDGGQYIPHPATWLNKERWKDEQLALVPPGDQPAAPRLTDLGRCPCGAEATVKVGGKPRCGNHIRTDFSTAAAAA